MLPARNACDLNLTKCKGSDLLGYTKYLQIYTCFNNKQQYIIITTVIFKNQL
jgi:hypothetical protein